MDRHASAWLLFAATLGAASPLASQAAPKAVCSSGRPADACRWFVITESRYHFNLTEPGTTNMRHYLLAEAGLMRNRSPTSAVGVTIWGGYDFGYDAARLGISARRRRWVSPHRSVEGSLGLAYSFQGHARSFADALGAAGRIDLNLGDLVNFGVRVEWMPEGARCPPQYATSYGCVESILISQTPDHILYQDVDRTERVRVWRVYAAAGVGSKAGVATWLAAGLMGIIAAGMGDCCSTAW